MTLSPRALRNCTDALCLVLGTATAATGLASLTVGTWERIMSAYLPQLICGAVFGCTVFAYCVSS